MVIEDISISQIMTVLLFIAGLVVVQMYISKNKNTLKSKWTSNQRIRVTDNTRISPTERVQIINVDGAEYLYFYSKGNQPVIVPMASSTKRTSQSIDERKAEPSLYKKLKPNFKKSNSASSHENTSKSDSKIIQAISAARKQNPTVSFE